MGEGHRPVGISLAVAVEAHQPSAVLQQMGSPGSVVMVKAQRFLGLQSLTLVAVEGVQVIARRLHREALAVGELEGQTPLVLQAPLTLGEAEAEQAQTLASKLEHLAVQVL